MKTISREQARKLLQTQEDLVVLEVLDEFQFNKFHLPNAQHIPLSDDFENEIKQFIPDHTRPILVYCMDAECKASSLAGQKLTELGYEKVYDYEAGKVDWKTAGLPIEVENTPV